MTKTRTILLVCIVLVISFVGGLGIHNNHQVDAEGCSDMVKVAHQVIINNSQVSPQITDSNICDSITFTNKDKVTREVGFGNHKEHASYNGISEKITNKDEAFTIRLNKTGSYYFHDHNHEEVMGSFNVYK